MARRLPAAAESEGIIQTAVLDDKHFVVASAAIEKRDQVEQSSSRGVTQRCGSRPRATGGS